MASSSRAAVRRATPYARITAAPTTLSATAASIAPIRCRTAPYGAGQPLLEASG